VAIAALVTGNGSSERDPLTVPSGREVEDVGAPTTPASFERA
jgi:hypothetical protein